MLIGNSVAHRPDIVQIPAVLYYQRVDSASTELDFSSLPQQPDYSILSEDRSISRKRDPRRIQHTPLQKEELPTAGTLISIDAEFVSLQQVCSRGSSWLFSSIPLLT